MTSTPSFIPSDFYQKIEKGSVEYAVEFTRMIFTMLWTAFKPFLPYAFVFFLLISIWSVIKALRGNWGQLGSIIYHVLFFGILAIAIALKGWEVLYNPYFDILYFLLYRFSYFITGLILRPFRKRH